MNSTLTLYFNSILNPEKNYALDDGNGHRTIEQYLSSLTSLIINDFQYIKHSLSLSIKLERGQHGLMMGANSQDLNYVKIQNGTENPCYYFVINKTWKSVSTIELVLAMDTLNSFTYNDDYLINKKTQINRQHKDRIKKIGEIVGNLLSQTNNFVIPNIGQPTYTYPAGYVFHPSGQDYTGTFTPVAGVRKYKAMQKKFYPPEQPEDEWHELDSKLELIFDIPTRTYKIRCKEDYSLPSGSIPNYVIKFSIYPVTECYVKEVDLISEGINAPVYKKELGTIYDDTNVETWFLFYRNQQAPDPNDQFNDSPVDCFLIPEHSISVINNSGAKVLTTGNVSSGTYDLFDSWYESGKQKYSEFKVGNQTFKIYRVDNKESFWEYANSKRFVFIVHSDGSKLSYQYVEMWCTYNSDGSIRSESKKVLNSGTLGVGDDIEIISPYDTILPKVYNSNPYGSLQIDTYDFPDPNDVITLGVETNVQCGNITSLDRTDSRNIKLIALPYCPAQTSLDSNGVLRVLNNFTYDSTTGWFKSNDVTTPFQNRFKSSQTESPFSILLMKNLEFNLNTERDDSFESKLLHSDYYRPKFVYDSFSYVYSLERFNFDNYLENVPDFSNPEFYVTYVMTRTINSKFLFKLDMEYITHSIDDYDGIINVSRNNEEVLYNSAYINYIRSGYNYDKKTLARKQETNSWGVGLSVASAVLGIIGSIATQNPLPAIMGVGAGAIGITGQIVNNIQTQAQGEQTIQQKLEEASRQAVAVASSDDIDLLTAYSGNKAKFVLYDVSLRMKKLLGDLFYYCGYKLEIQDIPNVASRYWFNFVQADLILIDTNNLSKDIEEDIIAKFKDGVTFFHYHNGFNFAQDKENWEVSLI